MRKILSSQTTMPNTPESDKLPKVMHNVVVVHDGNPLTLHVMATDPIDAQDIVRSLSDEFYSNLIEETLNKKPSIFQVLTTAKDV